MASSPVSSSKSRRRIATPIIALLFLFVIYVAASAMGAVFWNDDFPEALAIKLETWPTLFRLHMATGAVALLLVPIAIWRRRRRGHRALGRITVALVLVSGLTAYPVAWESPVTVYSRAGFMAQASVWITLAVAGVRSIRRGQIDRHRQWMLLMAATTFGAVLFRIILGLWAWAGDWRDYRLVYSLDAWGAWIVPLAITYFLLRRASLAHKIGE